MGLGSIVGGLLGGKPKGPSPEELQRRQQLAIEKERERMAAEQAAKEKENQDKALASLEETESKRRAFAGTLTAEGDETNRRKFLKSA